MLISFNPAISRQQNPRFGIDPETFMRHTDNAIAANAITVKQAIQKAKDAIAKEKSALVQQKLTLYIQELSGATN